MSFAALTTTGHVLWNERAPEVVRLVAVIVLLVLVAFDAAALRARARVCAIGPRRQTAKILRDVVGMRWAALVWGLDAGTALTTFRTTAATWALVVLCLLGEGTLWIGVAYAASFSIPLLVDLAANRTRHLADPSDRVARRALDGHLSICRWASISLTVVLVFGVIASPK